MYIDPITRCNQSTPGPGLLELTPEQEAVYLEYNGFVRIVSTDPVVIDPDTEAWEAWKQAEAEKPVVPPAPTADELVNILLGVENNG